MGTSRAGNISGGVCLLLLLCGSSHCAPADPSQTTKVNSASDSPFIYLDTKNPSVTQPIKEKGETVANAKFVQVEVAEVRNPNRYALTFEVHYQPKDGPKVKLGSFSLFPADNPGTFIVATQGKVKQGGAIVITMVVLDRVTSEPPSARIKSIALIRQ
jgi:hypothetical protein